MKVYQQADRILVEEAPIIPLTYGRAHLWGRLSSLSKVGQARKPVPHNLNPRFGSQILIRVGRQQQEEKDEALESDQ